MIKLKTFKLKTYPSLDLSMADINTEETWSNWKKSTCTCPIYFKQCICIHIIGICI